MCLPRRCPSLRAGPGRLLPSASNELLSGELAGAQDSLDIKVDRVVASLGQSPEIGGGSGSEVHQEDEEQHIAQKESHDIWLKRPRRETNGWVGAGDA